MSEGTVSGNVFALRRIKQMLKCEKKTEINVLIYKLQWVNRLNEGRPNPVFYKPLVLEDVCAEPVFSTNWLNP